MLRSFTPFASSVGARHLVRGAACLLAALLAAHDALALAPAPTSHASFTRDVVGTVTDSTSVQPVASAQVSVTRDGRIVLNTTTDDFGRYRVHNLVAGTYSVSVRALGFRAQSRAVAVDGTAGSVRADFHLATVPLSLGAIAVTTTPALALNTRTGEQIFREDDYHGAPTTRVSEILQQIIAGTARAPTGEVHIRGQHAEYTYYVDGIPVPAGISGSLNELFDPQVINQITFQTGGWDAEYGNKNAAVVNISTKVPAGGFHADASAYSGSFSANGQNLSLSTNVGRLGLYVSGARQATDMRRDPVAFDTLTFKPINFHNYGEDIYTFGKVSYSASSSDLLNLDANWSRTRFLVPFNPELVTAFDDRQQDINSFVNLGWRHQFGKGDTTALASTDASPSQLFAGLFYRHGTLLYTPGAGDEATFFFFSDTTTPYTISENRAFNTIGVKADFQTHPQHHLEFKTGVLASRTTGQEFFQATTQAGVPGPASNSGLSGSDVGVYAQVAYSPIEKIELRTGLRFDNHTAPFAGTQRQVSPRVRLNYFPTPATTLYAYYGRLFVPTNVEELRTITTAGSGEASLPTFPERDDFYELGAVHRFPFSGLVAKLSAYHKASSPGIDDATIPGTAIITSVNIAKIRVNGIETALEFQPSASLSGYVNASIIHAYGLAPITGGFLPSVPPEGYFDLDHDQRASVVASATYSPSRVFVSATAIYGSGLTNGITPSFAPEASYGTGLLAFNRFFKVAPNTIVNASAGYTFVTGRAVLRPQLFVENLFDNAYLLKGAFFSGASVGRPRSIQFRLNVGA